MTFGKVDITQLIQVCLNTSEVDHITLDKIDGDSQTCPNLIYSIPTTVQNDSNHKHISQEDEPRGEHPIDIHIKKSDSFNTEVAEAKKTVFFINRDEISKEHDDIQNENKNCNNSQNVMEYGCMTKYAAFNATLILHEVLLPILSSRCHENSNLADSTNLRYTSKFTAIVARATNQLKQGTRFELPKVTLEDFDTVIDDYDTIQNLEVFAMSWANIVSSLLEEEVLKEPIGGTPLAELDFWRQRHTTLSDLRAQVELPMVKNSIEVLRLAGSPAIQKVDEKFNDLKRLATEAEDNAKFLSTLERNFQTISTEPLSEILKTIPGLVDSIRMIWIVSRYYNREERLAPLMERIAYQLVARIKEFIKVDTFFRKDSEIAYFDVDQARQILECWRQTYMSVRARIEEGGAGQRRWELDRGRLFEKTDYMAGVCAELQDALITIDQFRRFLGPELASITGENGSVDAVASQVQKLPNIVEEVDFDIFDRKNSDKYAETMTKFNSRVQEIEKYANSCIEKAFQTLRSASGAFHLVENFKDIRSRPSIHQLIENRYSDILEQYDSELAHTEKNFQKRRHNPPVAVSFNEVSGSIAWADGLYQKVKRPILRFRSHNELLTSGFGNSVKHRYLRFARAIDSFKNHLFLNWHDSVDTIITHRLNQPVLMSCQYRPAGKDVTKHAVEESKLTNKIPTKRTERMPFSHDDNFPLVFKSNFSEDIFTLTSEAKILAKMGYKIPDSVLVTTLQEESYHRYTMELDAMTIACNKIIASLSSIEKHILIKHLSVLNVSMKPGLTTLNWTSQRIPAFVALANHAVEKFQSLLTELRKHASAIEDIINSIESSSLILKSDFRHISSTMLTVSEFTEIFKSNFNKRLDSMVQLYLSLRPLLLKVEMAVTESDNGSTSALSKYYLYWEKRIYNAIVQMVVRSLTTFGEIIKNHSNDIPLCKVDVVLEGREFLLSPPMNDIYKYMNKCTRMIIESPKKFVRWIKGSCIETAPQTMSDGVNEFVFTYSFYDDVVQNNLTSSAFIHLNKTLHHSFQNVNQCLTFWRRFEESIDLWDPKRRAWMEDLLDANYTLSSLQTKISGFETLESTFHIYEKNLLNLAQGIFLLDFAYTTCKLTKQVKLWKEDFGEAIHLSSKVLLDSFISTTESLKRDIEKEPQDLESLKFVLNTIKNISDMSMDMEVKYRDIRQRYEILGKYLVDNSTEEINAAMSLESLWKNIVLQSKIKDVRLIEIKEKFSKVTTAQAQSFGDKINELNHQFIETGPGSSSHTLDEGLIEMSQWLKRISELKAEMLTLNATQSLFRQSPSTYPVLLEIETKTKKLDTIYNFYRDFKEFESGQSAIMWNALDISLLKKGIRNLVQRCASFNSERNSYIFKAVEESIRNFSDSVPLITLLKNDAVKLRHWESLANLTTGNVNMSSDRLTLKSIFALDLHKFPTEVEEIIEQAMQENRIEMTIADIQKYWENAELNLQKYVKDNVDKGFILRAADDVNIQVEDHMLNLQTIGSSRFVSIFHDDVKKWGKQLNIVAECLEVWYIVQRKWMYLESIFIGSEDIRLQLPNEAKQFDSTSENFLSIMKSTNQDRNIVRACCAENRLNSLNDLSERLDCCQKSLSDYLDTKRNAFARFYFISDEELLSIMGSPDPTSIQVHLIKLFDNVRRVGFGKSNKTILSMESVETESFCLTDSVPVNGPVETWMTTLEEEMKKSLWKITKTAVFRYAKEDRKSWIASENTLGMTAISGSQIWWTWQVEDCFRRVMDGDKYALKQLESKLTNELLDMVAMVRAPLQDTIRKKVNTLLIIDVHARDIVTSFIRESVLDKKQFEWESQLRFYWDKKEDDCIINQCTGAFPYGYEYLGLSGRLIITPLTDRCYMTLTQALTFKLGGSPAGPAGTGKTETVKDLAKSLALPCFVINCGEGLDYKAMGATFSGLVQCGAWGCFDEFNRINIEVLSVVSAQLKAIQNAFMSESVTVRIGSAIDLVIKRIKGQATSGVFITMNPGYAGRTELPDNLKALFRPVTMIVPDLEQIAENMLFSEGFNNSKVLAKKMVVLYRLSKEQLSKQFHYDFGLRSMKTVLVMAGGLKRQYADMSEDLVLMRILRDANMPKFVFEDVPLFLGLINDLFPGISCPRVGYENLRNAIASDLEKNGYHCTDETVYKNQIDKILQIFETQIVRHTTMVVGPTGGGKSLALQTLRNARMQHDGTSIKTWVINPKAQSLNELYGVMDPVTRDWTDGVLSKIFRDLNQPLPQGRESEIRWIIFDGDVDALWVENLNSVMDDNRLLTLPNGERIRLQSHCAIICEVFDLQYASPATISRCGMVWVDPKNLGYRPFFERWARQRYGEDNKALLNSQNEKPFLLALFDTLVVPCMNLALKGNKFGEKLLMVVHVGEMSLCRQLCSLLDSFLPAKGHKDSNADIEAVFLNCIIWSIGAPLDEESRVKFDLFIKDIHSSKLPANSLYDYFYSIEEHAWINWQDRVTEYVDPSPYEFHKIMVPTSVSTLYKTLLERMVPRTPVLLVGESGTAKTLTIEKYMEMLPFEAFTKLKINMSSRTTSYNVQLNIEGNVDKRMGNIYGPVSGKKLVVFIDDLNMPKVDSYGTQQPISLLLTLLDHGFVYTRDKDNNQKFIKDLQYIGAMPPPGGARNEIDPRFVARFNVFHLTSPKEDILMTIYSKIIESRMIEHGDDVLKIARNLTSSTLKLFNFIVDKLPPTPSKFHYIFNLRDLSRVYEGLCCVTEEKMCHGYELVRLWRNEIHRVFCDRLISEEDFLQVDGKLREIIMQSFEESSEHALNDPLVFGDFENAAVNVENQMESPRLYGDMGDYSQVCKIFAEMMEHFNMNCESKPLSLVLFDMAISHLVRLMRILKHPRGNALLIGIGGSGKQSLSRLATYSCGYEIFEISLSRGFGETQFKEALKELYKKLTVGPTVFLFSDSNIVEEGFLEYVNNMLCTGIHPNLFDGEEKDAICNLIRGQAKENGILDTQECLWDYFTNICRNNLHIILAMSPSGEKLRLRCRNFPGLVSACTIDWFFPWPLEALEKVATNSLGQETNIPKNLHTDITKHIAFVHQSVTKKAEDYREMIRRQYFVTTKHYLDFISNYLEQLRQTSKTVDVATRRLEGGLCKLVEASQAVDRMQIDLQKKKVVLETKTADVENLIGVIQDKTSTATTSNIEVSNKKKDAESQAIIIVEEKNKADSALMEALPAVEAAAEALNNIKREDLQELKAFNNPPIHVKIVCQMCTVLRPTNEKLDETWADSKKMLGNNRLLDLLKEYPKDSMTEKMFRSCQRILKDNKKHDISVENMATKSKAGAGLLTWVLAILRYYEVAKDVEPLREKVKAMEKAQANTEKELLELQEAQSQLNEELKKLNLGYKNANKELDDLQYQAATLEKRLDAASKLINGLTGERTRWGLDIKELTESRSKLIGDCLLGACYLSYMGAFTADYRHDIIHTLLKNDIMKRGIPLTSNFSLKNLLSNDSTIQSWNANGLPTDEHSTQNGIITVKSTRFPLCIDPQQQAIAWIKRTYEQQQLTVKKLTDKDFMKHIELAIQFGNPFLFENVVEEIDPILDPVLEQNVITEGGKKTILLGEKRLDWNDKFRIFFCTRLSNPSYSPEVMGKLTLINYCVTKDGLSDQLLNVVVSHERPELETQFNTLVSEMATNSQLLVNLEDTLLKELSSSSGNILDNEELIFTLEETKNKANEIRSKIEEATITQKKINDARNEYRIVAIRGSILYFSSSCLSTINSMYEISLDYFLRIFKKALDDAIMNSSLDSRLKNLIDSCTTQIYDATCTGIFERHKLTFAFRLTCMILEEDKKLDSVSLSFFLKGDTSLTLASEPKPKDLYWISDNGWKDLLFLTRLNDAFVSVKHEICSEMTIFKNWYDLESPEESVIQAKSCLNLTPMQNLCLTRILRTDRSYNAVKLFVKREMGEHFVQPPVINYEQIFQQSSPYSPILFILSPGADPQVDIQKLGERYGFTAPSKFRFISLGQGQGPIALQMLSAGYSRGHWILLQNCHLLISWLSELDQTLDQMKTPHKDFRLWLTTEPSEKFPLGLLQRSSKVVTEPPDGMKLNMKGVVSKIDQDIIEECPHPCFHPLLYVLTFLHAVLQERRKYGKIGWNVKYDFNESDFSISRKLMSLYLTKAWEARDESLPWGSLKYLIGDAMYGGRVSDEMDRRVLSTYLEEYMGDFLFDKNSKFFFSQEGFEYTLPNDTSKSIDEYTQYIESFPLSNSPAVFGLHANAEIGYFMSSTNEMLGNLLSLQPRSIELDGSSSHDDYINEIADEILQKVPIIKPDIGSFDVSNVRAILVEKEPQKLLSPCKIVLLQELERWNGLCKRISSSLLLLKQALSGEVGMSDNLDEIGESLFNGLIPRFWTKLAPLTEKKLGGWMIHFERRYAQYTKWIEDGEPPVIWLSGLHIPESYFTALIQTTCRRKGWPLDKSTMYTLVTNYTDASEIIEQNKLDDGCYVTGLYLEGAGWDIERGKLKKQDPKVLVVELPILQVLPIESSKIVDKNTFRTPVYVTSQRRNAAGVGLVFEADLATDVHPSIWVLNGVALVLNTSD